MSYLKNLPDIFNKVNKNSLLLFVGLLAVIVVLMRYNVFKGMFLSGMTNSKSNNNTRGEKLVMGSVQPAMPAGKNEDHAKVNGIDTVTRGLPSNCDRQQVTNPADLLPKDSNNDWGAFTSQDGGELAGVNLLKAGYHNGIDTVGSSLRNANLQLRPDPPNPRGQPGPWMQSTIEPDQYQRVLT